VDLQYQTAGPAQRKWTLPAKQRDQRTIAHSLK
jgi:hypothetical protein